jgi:hypothetical protein
VSTITIYGASDDLIEVAGCDGAGEFDCFGSQQHALNWHATLTAPDGSAMQVMAWYGPGGCWLLGIGQADENKEFPPWPVAITQGVDGDATSAYSVVLTVEAPEGTKLGDVWPDRRG